MPQMKSAKKASVTKTVQEGVDRLAEITEGGKGTQREEEDIRMTTINQKP